MTVRRRGETAGRAAPRDVPDVGSTTTAVDVASHAARVLSETPTREGLRRAAEIMTWLPGVSGVSLRYDDGIVAAGAGEGRATTFDLGQLPPVGRAVVYGDERGLEPETMLALDILASVLTVLLGRLRAETELEHGEEHARAVVATSLDAIVAMDQGGVIREFNPAAERTFGHRRDDVVGRLLADVLVPARHRKAHLAGMERYLATGRSKIMGHRVEMPAICADGREITVELAISPTQFDGEAAFIGFLRDITAQTETKRRLEETTSRLSTLIGSLHAAVLVEDENRKIVVTNAAFTEMFGIPAPPEALLGADCSRAAEDASPLFEEPATFVRSVEAALAGRVPVIGEEFSLLDGRVLERDYVPVFREEEYLGHLWLYRDVTVRKESERRLVEQNRMLVEVAESKDRFLAAVSHELRTPLTAVMSFSEILAQPSSGPLTEEQREYVEVVQRNAAQLLHLVDDLLTLMRAESHGLTLHVETFDLATVIRQGAVEHARRAAEREVDVTVDVPDVMPVEGDPVRVRQVLDNLLGNAVKFSRPGGTVTVSAVSDGAIWRLRVRDSGIGIPEADQPRVFSSFFRASNTRSLATPGTGLGLVISRAIVELHGGTMTLTSQEGKGTTVTVILPVRLRNRHEVAS